MPEPVAIAGEGGRHRIGVFEFDAGILELRKNGRVVKVRPQSLKLLNLLLGRAGELVQTERMLAYPRTRRDFTLSRMD